MPACSGGRGAQNRTSRRVQSLLCTLPGPSWTVFVLPLWWAPPALLSIDSVDFLKGPTRHVRRNVCFLLRRRAKTRRGGEEQAGKRIRASSVGARSGWTSCQTLWIARFDIMTTHRLLPPNDGPWSRMPGKGPFVLASVAFLKGRRAPSARRASEHSIP